ncbi:hypothetical protein MRS44_005180 [Fusarium solani]|uniref:uncharacterized protein n=1 Tax=Fusarium solani TaxID=169388 RepID=UPI0032C4403B|nr:hypothetical protein MRS44_005180 [Fusarium solani]
MNKKMHLADLLIRFKSMRSEKQSGRRDFKVSEILLLAILRKLPYESKIYTTVISASFTSQSSIIPDAAIINADTTTVSTNTSQTTTSSRILYNELQRHNQDQASSKVESVFKRKLALERGLHVKTEGKPSPDEDGDIIFGGPNSLSSAPAPGRYSCGGLCNHDAATTSAPTPVMARERKPVTNPFVSSSRTLEVISLISDSEEDDGDFPSPPTRKGKEQARAQPRFSPPPTFPLAQLWTRMVPSYCLILEEAHDCSQIQLWRLLLLPLWIGIVIVPPGPFLVFWGARPPPQWPSMDGAANWLRQLQAVYNTDPARFHLHIDAWYEEIITRVRVFWVDDYADWIALNYGQYRCFTGIFQAFPLATLTAYLQAVHITSGHAGSCARFMKWELPLPEFPQPGSRIPKKIYTATQKYTAEEFQQVPPSTRETSHLRDFSYCLNPLHLVAEPHLDNMRGTSHHEASAR